jgi:predicted PurR-regulated permease PerM
LHPITVILTILAGASLLGIFGGLLAVPIVALLKLLLRKYWLGSRYHALENTVANAPPGAALDALSNAYPNAPEQR